MKRFAAILIISWDIAIWNSVIAYRCRGRNSNKDFPQQKNNTHLTFTVYKLVFMFWGLQIVLECIIVFQLRQRNIFFRISYLIVENLHFLNMSRTATRLIFLDWYTFISTGSLAIACNFKIFTFWVGLYVWMKKKYFCFWFYYLVGSS